MLQLTGGKYTTNDHDGAWLQPPEQDPGYQNLKMYGH
jgi:hypothetical protein